jgi:hypothetical protein
MFKARLRFFWDTPHFYKVIMFLSGLNVIISLMNQKWMSVTSIVYASLIILMYASAVKFNFKNNWIGEEIVEISIIEYYDIKKFSNDTGIPCYTTTNESGDFFVHFLNAEDRALWELTRET